MPSSRTMPSSTSLALAALCVLAPPAAAESGSTTSSPSIQHVTAAAKTETAAASPEGCAADYHASFDAIASAELTAYRDARATIGEVDPALPGRLLFEAPRRPHLSAEARRAVEAGTVLARRQGRTSFARDANTRWIAERIREDLTDYLTQKPTPFLCAGVDNYLSTLRTYAAQGAPSPARLAEDRGEQARTASVSLDAAFAAMQPAPLPRFAPADRPAGPAMDGLRLALESSFRGLDSAPTRVAERSSASRISESRIDPDLPPLGPAGTRSLSSAEELSRAITALLATAERRGFIADRGPLAGARPEHRPVLARLGAVRTHLGTPGGRIADPLVRQAFEQALFDLEVLDYLDAATAGTADPLGTALHATLDAIEAARERTCTCAQ